MSMSKRNISMIAAVAKNRAIGYKNRLLYNLPDDLKFFRKTTAGNVVVMGGNTYKSLPNGPLPNRLNIVVSTSIENEENYENLMICKNSDELFNFIDKTDKKVFIIGGASMYNLFIDEVNELYLTEIDAEPDNADTYFPYFDKNEFEVVWEEQHDTDEKHEVPFRFVHYKKKIQN